MTSSLQQLRFEIDRIARDIEQIRRSSAHDFAPPVADRPVGERKIPTMMWTPAQVAERLNVSVSQVYRLSKSEIPCVKFKGRGRGPRQQLRFEQADVEAWLTSNKQIDGGAK
jgi:excisionase family DNA binding protein